MMATIHFMHGFIGSGKTTFSKKLEKELPAIRFNNDELMLLLFGNQIPEHEFKKNYKKIDSLIWFLVDKNLKLGNDVIIDLGFWSRGARDAARRKAKELGADFKFYNIKCPLNIALERTLKRTKEQGEMFIDENCFNKRLAQFEPMDYSEDFVLIDNSKEK